MKPACQEVSILAIDDEVGILELVKATLESEGYVVHTATGPSEGIHFYGQAWQSIKLVVMDFMMPETKGGLLLERLQDINPKVRVMLLTGNYKLGDPQKFNSGLCGCMLKPFNLDDLSRTVRNAIENAPRG